MNKSEKLAPWYRTLQGRIALLAAGAILLSLSASLLGAAPFLVNLPLLTAYLFGGTPLLYGLLRKAIKGEFGSDLLAGISIVTAVLLDQHLAGVFVILMLSGGEAIENYALRRASSVLDALAQRMPHVARRRIDGVSNEIPLSEVKIGDLLEVPPHDITPVDGLVREGNSAMDESYLTGEPFQIRKAPGSSVISGAINGESLLLIEATALPLDSRYQKIAQVIESQASKQVPLRRLGDALGAWYTPLALIIASLAWYFSGDANRFLAVLVVATPCPLLIAIPVAIIGAISDAARRGIIIKNPAALETLTRCTTIILDKTGTLTYGKPGVTSVECAPGISKVEVLRLVGAVETYSKHPLAEAVVRAAKELIPSQIPTLPPISSITELPGKGLSGICEGKRIAVTGRSSATAQGLSLPPPQPGLECVVLIDDVFAAVIHFEDLPRLESHGFVSHLGPSHGITKVMIMSGDREREVQHLGKLVGITDVQGGLSPEEKLRRVFAETQSAPTLYLGDGINDAPALQAATVGIALGSKSDITSEASDAVILEQSLERLDDLIHIARRMRRIALQSAVGGMGLSVLGMGAASAGFLTPLAGAITQELIDVLAVLNALRTASSDESDRHSFVNPGGTTTKTTETTEVT
jgi:heavy metal translocating P-type ATPase